MKKSNLKSLLLHGFMFLLVIAGFITIYYTNRQSYRESRVINFDSGWDVSIRDEKFEDATLSELIFDMASYGDKIVLTNTIPEDVFSRASLCLSVDYEATKVYVEDELIYEYGFDLLNEGTILGYGKQFISLPDNSNGKTIRIEYIVTENDEVTAISCPVIYDETTMLSDFIRPRAVTFVISVAIALAGLCVTIITFCLFFKSYKMEKLICIGIFSLCVGCWSLCNSSLTILFTSSLVVKIYLEYISLYLSPIPILLYFREDVESRAQRIETFIFYALFFIGTQLLIITVVTQVFEIFHFPVFLKVYQTYMFCCCLYLLYVIIKDITSVKHHTTLFIGMLVILAVAVRDLVVFNIVKYGLFGRTDGNYNSYVSVGSLIFILSMVVDFVSEMRSQVVLATENEFLQKIAYMDVLTGLYTRRKCEESFEELGQDKKEYSIIQFDLNNLKSTNDLQGHDKGDELLIRFAQSLRMTYTSGEIVGRMGGDEFIVIIPDSKKYNVEESLTRLEKNIERDNKDHKDLIVSSSYGYCRSSELADAVPRQIYMEADKRMYESKKRYYQENGGGRRREDNN